MGRFALCLIIALVSGAAALSHELLWTRRLVDILGATGQATSLVLGCFFFGLSVGSAVASRRVDGIRNPWRALAMLELTIALLTLPAAFLPSLTEWIWPAMGPELLTSWTGQLVKLAISALVVVPPAIAMGMTLPFLVVAVEKNVNDSRSAKILVYALNTLGGACGLLATSAWLLQTFGVVGCMVVAMSCNVAVAVIAWALRNSGTVRKRNSRDIGKADVNADATNGFSDRARLGIAAFSGMTVLGLEVVAIRMLSLVVHSSFQATSSLLLCVILLLGIAALLVPLLQYFVSSTRWLLIAALSLSAIGSAVAPQLLLYRTQQLINVPTLAAIEGKSLVSIFDFQVNVLAVAVASIGGSIFFAGLVFPILFGSVPRDSTEQTKQSGRHWAMLLAANGLGGLAGAILAENVAIPTFGIYLGMLAIGVIQAGAALALGISMANWKQAAMAAISILICLGLIPNAIGLPYITPRSKVKFTVEQTMFGPEGVCLVTQTESGGRGILMNNQYLLGSSMAFDAQRRLVLIPALFHGKSTSPPTSSKETQICCLGLATGISAGAALDYDESCHLTAIELSPLVVSAARDHFAAENRGVVASPRATVVVEDARTWISAVRNKYDIIVGDLYRPYGAGEGRLFSVEHFRNVRQALVPGGTYCQWIPAYQVTEEQFNMIAATFLEAFPDAALLRVESDSFPKLGLLGGKDAGSISWDEVESRCQDFEDRGVGDAGLHDFDGVKRMYVGKLSDLDFEHGQINTLNNARLEIQAGRHRVTLDPRTKGRGSKDAYLQGDDWKRFSQRLDKLAN